jgi:hypothetical protein
LDGLLPGIRHNAARVLARRSKPASDMDLVGMLEEFSSNVLLELNYGNEFYNAYRLNQNMANIPGVHIPIVYAQFSSSRVLTMEFVRGVKLSNIEAIKQAGQPGQATSGRNHPAQYGEATAHRWLFSRLAGQIKWENLMTYPTILGIGTALPKNCYEQMQVCAGLAPGFHSQRAPAVFQATVIETRYSVVDDFNWLLANPSNGNRLRTYMVQALPLGVEAIQQALDQARLAPAEVDDLIVASCTGVDTPSLDVKIAEAMGMSPYLRRSSLNGMGCQALMPGLYQAANTVLAQPQRRVVVLTVELCTLHFQLGRTLKNMLGSALFADGASAVVVAYDNGGQPGPPGGRDGYRGGGAAASLPAMAGRNQPGGRP